MEHSENSQNVNGEVASPTQLPYPVEAHTPTGAELTERQMKARLYAKLARVMGRMTRLEKNGENTFFHYRFVTSEDVADMVRAELAGEGVAFFADMGDIEEVAMEVTTSKGEKKIVKTRVHFIFTFADGETGYFEERHWVSDAIDDQDKALNKAATAAEKYFLLKTFIIGTGDDPDRDGEKGGKVKSQAPKAQTRADFAQAPRPQPQAQPQAPAQTRGDTSQARGDTSQARGDTSQAVQNPWGSDKVKVPADAKDLTTYFSETAKALKVSREEAAAVLKRHGNDAVKAAQALISGEK